MRSPRAPLPPVRLLHRLLAMLLAVLLVLPIASTLIPPPAAAAARPDPSLRVMVVLDVSGSMARDDGAGRSLLRGAKRALHELLRSLPRGTVAGVRVYGSQYAGSDRSVSCRDTRLLVPPGPVDPARAARAVRGLRPTGDTPIGLALERAAADLGRGPATRRVVVLVSDGEDNCSPPDRPPCVVARGLGDRGVDVQVQTIGFALGGARGGASARSALRCISRATQGAYYDARNADALSAALERISRDTLGGLGRAEPVRGGRSRSRAPLVEPGSYRVSLLPGDALWFRFRAPRGAEPRVLATVKGLASLVVPTEDRRCPAWRVELYNPFGEGGTYPPYGNAGRFDGVGFGVTGASSAGPVSPRSLGIDYSGTWAVQVSLARDTLGTCSRHLPVARPFPARFSVATGLRGDAGRDRDSGAPSPSSAPEASPSSPAARAGVEPREEAAGEKYRTRVREGAPAWAYPLVAVGLVLLAGAVAGGVVLSRRRRTRGW